MIVPICIYFELLKVCWYLNEILYAPNVNTYVKNWYMECLCCCLFFDKRPIIVQDILYTLKLIAMTGNRSFDLKFISYIIFCYSFFNTCIFENKRLRVDEILIKIE